MEIQVISTAFSDGERIPKKYTGEGEDVSPPISWSNVPEGTKELVLICDDPDAPTEEPWVHWVVYKIPVAAEGLPEGLPNIPRLKNPSGAFQGKNSWNHGHTIGYRGPMPPPDHGVHHYRFTVYALRVKLTAEVGLSKTAVMTDMHDYIIGEGRLTGTYQR